MGVHAAWLRASAARIREHVAATDAGAVAPPRTGIKIWPDRPSLVWRPDVLFVRKGRIAAHESSRRSR